MMVAAAAFLPFSMMMSAAALAFCMIMMVVAAAAFLSFAVMMSAAALAFCMIMMVVAAAAFLSFTVMMPTAAFACLVIVMVVTAAALPIVVMVVMAAAATAAAAVMARQRNRLKRSLGRRHGEADALKQALQLVIERQGEATLGLSDANAASCQRIDGLLHQIHVARHLENGLHAGLDDIEMAALVHEHVINLEGTGLAKGVFQFDSCNSRKGRGSLKALIKGQNDLVGTGKKSRCRNRFQGKKLRDFHDDFLPNADSKSSAF